MQLAYYVHSDMAEDTSLGNVNILGSSRRRVACERCKKQRKQGKEEHGERVLYQEHWHHQTLGVSL